MPVTTIEGLECKVGLGRIVLPTDQIDMLGEYRVGARLPSAERVGFAIGAWGDEAVLSVSLTAGAPVPSRNASGVMLAAARDGIRCVFEIGAALGLVTIASLAPASSVGARWLRIANLEDGRSVQYVDVGAMMDALGGAA